ncbi:unnamed protein product [Acanthoscelides obtectus]|uniref:Uncharacterized protein n=1 Tax=Acanthoscelides obtectus TaxID=200917 RepID=A0A9P0LX75_ACAOB|nr:unnamed protein product [Acanthoscelides obtectus]CAK1668399.1 Zinc finger and BTB domain-containing protein 14 [Acanthoscelides obtectus]
MSGEAEICESYQLKWGLYPSYMHSCISTALYNDSFTDVALVTTDGHQIMAHRFVLSYSSVYLAQILKLQRKVTTALPLMIVLPQEIDHKCLKVLVRYMYSGEAKVSKDILKNVLRGGDILQIKGLYREKGDPDRVTRITQQQQAISQPAVSPVSISQPSTSGLSKATTVPPSQPGSSAIQTKLVAAKQNKTPHKTMIVMPVNTEKGKQPLKTVTLKPGSIPKVLNFSFEQTFKKIEDQSFKKIQDQSITESKSNENADKNNATIKPEPKETNNLQFLVIKDEPIDWSEADMEIIESKEVFDDIKSEPTDDEEQETTQQEDQIFSPLTCELCTETFTVPSEWVRHVQTHTDMLPAKRRRHDSSGESYENDTFPELMCDLCQKGFSTPAEWVKHIQNEHTEFELHMSNVKDPQYKKIVPVMAKKINKEDDKASKQCPDCQKVFPSQASMLVHKRSHTGEKPYGCGKCNKASM